MRATCLLHVSVPLPPLTVDWSNIVNGWWNSASSVNFQCNPMSNIFYPLTHFSTSPPSHHMVDRRGLKYPHRGWYNAIYMLMHPHVHAFRCNTPGGWGVCLILDTDTESYVTSPSVCVCVCVCVLMSVQFQLWVIQEMKPLLVAVEILFFISWRCLQIPA